MLELDKVLNRFAKHVVTQSKANLTRGGKKVSSKLYDSITSELNASKNSFSLSIVGWRLF